MPLASLFAVPKNQGDAGAWSFAHLDHHRSLNAAVMAKYGVKIPEYPIDPFGDNVADLHQLWHNDIDAVIGVQGFDLSDVNWEDEGQRTGWIWLNATQHRNEGNILGVG